MESLETGTVVIVVIVVKGKRWPDHEGLKW